MTSVWEDKAFRHQWVTLPGVLRRGELAATRDALGQLGELDPEACRRCDAAREIWHTAEEDLQTFLGRLVELGHLSEVPNDEGASAAVSNLRMADKQLAKDLIEHLDVRDRALDAFAQAKESVLKSVLSGQSNEHVVWALAHEAGIVPGEVGDAAHLDPAARCLLLALAHAASTRRHLLSWILLAVTWPQSSHRCGLASQLGGMQTFTCLRLVENLFVPVGSDREQPLQVRALCTLAILAISSPDRLAFRHHAGRLRAHELREEAGQQVLGDLAGDLWLRWGALTHGSRADDFDSWLASAFDSIQVSVQALGPPSPPSAAPDTESLADRRHEARVHALNLVNVGSFNEMGLLTELETGRTIDLSQDGMRVEIHHPVSVHSTVGLSLALGEAVVSITAEVRSLEVLEAGLYAIGLQFLYLSEGGGEAIQAYLEAKASS